MLRFFLYFSLISSILLWACSTNIDDNSTFTLKYLKNKNINTKGELIVIVINNLGCNSCTQGSLEELKLCSEYKNNLPKLILLAKKDTNYISDNLTECRNCSEFYDDGTMSKYGLLNAYPRLLVIKNEVVLNNYRFKGQ